MGKLTTEYEYRVLDKPDCYIDLNNYFFVSSTEDDDEHLDFFIKNIFPYWSESQCSLHQLAEYLKPFNIELTYHDHHNSQNEDLPKNLISIWMNFNNQNNKAILLQCIIKSSENLQ